ncbi:MAG: AAA family ATPase, partial [Bacteroidetes bacterium]|nr:AAA family ATPase [Bacteroidota bacterium]
MEKRFASEVEAADSLYAAYQQLQKEVQKVIIGQDEVVRLLLTSIFCQGHSLLIGVPGLAKTRLIQTLAATMHLSYNRIQFTPDLMPSDILGSETLDKDRNFKFIKGPVFANIVLADEINRTPPKTQAALLEKAYREAGIDPRSVSYIEAHGTGTPLGDPVEINGLKHAFRNLYQDQPSELQ